MARLENSAKSRAKVMGLEKAQLSGPLKHGEVTAGMSTSDESNEQQNNGEGKKNRVSNEDDGRQANTDDEQES